jgi:hypothetical protein
VVIIIIIIIIIITTTIIINLRCKNYPCKGKNVKFSAPRHAGVLASGGVAPRIR